MPRSPRTQLTLRREKILRNIRVVQQTMRWLEEELEEVTDLIRDRGSYSKDYSQEPMNQETKQRLRLAKLR